MTPSEMLHELRQKVDVETIEEWLVGETEMEEAAYWIGRNLNRSVKYDDVYAMVDLLPRMNPAIALVNIYRTAGYHFLRNFHIEYTAGMSIQSARRELKPYIDYNLMASELHEAINLFPALDAIIYTLRTKSHPSYVVVHEFLNYYRMNYRRPL